MPMKTPIGRVALGLCGVLFAGAAQAAANCTVSASGLAFGSYNASVPSVSYTGTVSVRCTGNATTFTLALSAGSSGNILARSMTSGSARLSYQLYTDAAHTNVWGNGATGVLYGPLSMPGGNFNATYTVYGLLLPTPNVPSGSYADTVTVTLTAQ